jgi:phosphoribosyl-dephospho-CoA transferase
MGDPSMAGWGSRAAPARHALLRVKIEAWSTILADRTDLRDEPILLDWAALSRPLVVRRATPDDPRDAICAGIPLPPSHDKKRIAITLTREAISSVEPPLPLASCRATASASWLPTIDALLDFGRRIGIPPRVFGSFAWSALTGLDYVSAGSDLDLLWAVTPETDFGALLTGLARIEANAPGRLDGELVRIETNVAANWRELHAGADQILVKTIAGVALRPASVLVGAWRTGR